MKKTIAVILIVFVSLTCVFARQSVSVSQGLMFSDVIFASHSGANERGLSFGAPVMSAVAENPDDPLGALKTALVLSKLDVYSMTDVFAKSRFIDLYAGPSLSITRLNLGKGSEEEPLFSGVYAMASANLRSKLQFNVGNIGLFASADYPVLSVLMRTDKISVPVFVSVFDELGRTAGLLYTELLSAKAGVSIRF